MKRRQLLKYASLGMASWGITACTKDSLFNSQGKQGKANSVFSPLEKTNLILGFVALTDAAPLIVAQEKGFFDRYGLTVTLKRFSSWEGIEKGLLEWRLDAAQTPFALPMLAQLGKKKAALISLMNLNLNGSAITITQKAWEKGIRPSPDYTNFREFEDGFRQYIRNKNQSANFAVDSPISMDAYLTRYWLAALGIAPDTEVKFLEFPASQMSHKLQAGMIEGYTASAPWSQSTILEKVGFVTYVSRDIWKGHPNKVLATMDGWARKNPATARALMAALLEACQFSDRINNYAEVSQILAKSPYLNLNASLIQPSLSGQWTYSGEERGTHQAEIPDFTIFHHREASYLKDHDHANYPWRSHGVWLLTQMIRWNQLEQLDYPQDGDKLLDKIYPVTFYEEVAKALNIALPNDKMKQEPATAFIDSRSFDPSQPVAYLNQFSIRATRPQIFGFA